MLDIQQEEWHSFSYSLTLKSSKSLLASASSDIFFVRDLLSTHDLLDIKFG